MPRKTPSPPNSSAPSTHTAQAKLDWHTIKSRALVFSQTFAQVRAERSEAQTFWNEFFAIYGIERRRVSVFEHKVEKLNKNAGFIDLFWPGTLLVEHKSAGHNLELAAAQAEDYFLRLKEGEHPRYLLTCDFQNFWLKDLDEGTEQRFTLAELPQKVALFSFLRGQKSSPVHANDPVNDKAVKKLSRLHHALAKDGYTGRDLELLLVRLLFCLFADKTGLFEPAGTFTDLIESATFEDGSNLGQVVRQLFDELDTEFSRRQKSVPGWFKDYPYVNGKLFAEKIRIPSFNAAMRELLLDCCHTDWSKISPAIFGSMFQHVMDLDGKDSEQDLRRELGAHYTSEDNIQKLIGPLFLDELKAEFERVRHNKNHLFEFQKKLRGLRFLDPACGCGNFLVVTYRELRLLELDVLRAAQQFGAQFEDPFKALTVNVDQFYGMEVEAFPALVAQVALWLVDHQMNMQASELLQRWLPRLPLAQSAHIRIGNALDLDWREFCPPSELSYILGNPPFIGKSNQNAAQKADMERLAASAGLQGAGVLDYVAGWYIKAAQYLRGDNAAIANAKRKAFMDAQFARATTASLLDAEEEGDASASPLLGAAASTAQGHKHALAAANDLFELEFAQDEAARTKIRVAFVSTNSITQGEQVGVLWSWMLKEGMRIEFAHRTFSWSNEASGQAAVHCVIIGFGLSARIDALPLKRLFDYDDPKDAPIEAQVSRINPYLADAADIALPNRKQPLFDAPPTMYGNKPTDGGNLVLSDEDKIALIKEYPSAAAFIKPMVSAEEFLHNQHRWCLWLKDAPPSAWADIKPIRERVDAVKKFRAASSKAQTRADADIPALFAEVRQPESDYILIPSHSSERRQFIPLGFCSKDIVVHNSCTAIPDATLYHFGVLMSTMHMAWVRTTCGRLKSDFRYSAGIVYNNFPWPENTSAAHQAAIEAAAQGVLDARAANKDSSLAQLYDPTLMPRELLEAHKTLDKAVDAAYKQAHKEQNQTTKPSPTLKTDAQRVAYLFSLYQRKVELAQEQETPAAQ